MTHSLRAITLRRAILGSIASLTITAVLGCEATSPSPVIRGGHAANQAFLQQYEQARARIIQQTPLVVLAIGGNLLVVRDGNITGKHNIIPPAYTALKEVSHVIVALWVATWNNSAKGAAEQTAALAPHVEALSKGLADSVIPEKDRSRQLRLLEAAKTLVRAASSPTGISDEELTKWARSIAPDILENVFEAAQAELELVNSAMTQIVASMTPEQREGFIVIVGGVHQARSRNLLMQYFAALLGPEATQDERRLIYGESISDSAGALDLLGTHLVDQAMADDFFANPSRMQSDLLGDAALKIIPKLVLPPLDH